MLQHGPVSVLIQAYTPLIQSTLKKKFLVQQVARIVASRVAAKKIPVFFFFL